VTAELRHGSLEGPWDQAFYFELPGAVRSKSNARRFTGDAGQRRAYGAERLFAQQTELVARVALPTGWELGPPPPASLGARPQVVAAVVARTTLDATNVPKSIHDALEGVVFHNDASVRAASQLTVRGREGGGAVAFARLPATASCVEVAEANAKLLAALLAHCVELR
jgi:hypothetical protein